MVSTDNEKEFEKICINNNVSFSKLGKTQNSNEISFNGYSFDLKKLKNTYLTIIEKEIENV